jgi:hypothetical protein
MRIANYVMIPLFLMCVVVQYNDPDPIRWMTIYGAALICCILFAYRKLPKWLPLVVAAVALIWAITIPPSFWGKMIPMDEVFSMIHMIHPGVEEVREMLGLLIVAAWMIALWFQVRGSKSPKHP